MFELGLDFYDHRVEFNRQRRTDQVQDRAVFADDVIHRLFTLANLVEAGPVVEETPAHESEIFKCSQAAIDGHQIT